MARYQPPRSPRSSTPTRRSCRPADLDDPPLVRPDEVASGWRGHPLDFPDLTFDADQYTSEVQRISAEREWESDRWRTALCLDEYMHPGNPWTRWELAWVEPIGNDTYRATCLDGYDTGIEVTLTPPPGSPAKRARWMADYLLSARAEDWPITRSFPHAHLMTLLCLSSRELVSGLRPLRGGQAGVMAVVRAR